MKDVTRLKSGTDKKRVKHIKTDNLHGRIGNHGPDMRGRDKVRPLPEEHLCSQSFRKTFRQILSLPVLPSRAKNPSRMAADPARFSGDFPERNIQAAPPSSCPGIGQKLVPLTFSGEKIPMRRGFSHALSLPVARRAFVLKTSYSSPGFCCPILK